jgi:ankyrin repeat protein
MRVKKSGDEMFLENIVKTHELFKAAKTNDIQTLKILLGQGVNINIKDKKGMTPLMWAAYYCHFNIVELLLDNGANVNIKNNFGETAFYIVDHELYPEIGELLIEHGSTI